MNKYEINEETIKKILLYSAYALPDRPGERGLKAENVKRYFYEFINKLVEAINLGFSSVAENVNLDLSNHDGSEEAHEYILGLITDLNEADANIRTGVTNEIAKHDNQSSSHPYILQTVNKRFSEHNTDESAHEDIRTKIGTDIDTHNKSSGAHSDIRKLLGEIKEKANSAFNLANGKSKIYPMYDISGFLNVMRENVESYNQGDTFTFYQKNIPDLVLHAKGTTFIPGHDDIDLTNGGIPEGFDITPGIRIFVNGTLFVGKESGVDVSKLATDEELKITKEALEALISDLDKRTEEIVEYADEIVSDAQKRAEEVDGVLDLKENVFLQEESIQSEITLENHTEYSLGLLFTLSLILPSKTDGMETIINFRTGAQAPSFDAPASLVFSGDDTYGGRFYPIAHRIYEISVKEVMGVLSARVGACDYEVIE